MGFRVRDHKDEASTTINSLRSSKPFLKYIPAIPGSWPHSNLAVFFRLSRFLPTEKPFYTVSFLQFQELSMSELQRQDTLTRAVVAALGVTISPTKIQSDDRDDQTIRGVSLEADPVLVDTSIFDILSEFKLDLCLSPPASPTASVSNLPPSTPSPRLSPTLSRSISFTSAKAATATKKSMKKKPSKVSSSAPARSRGSWPLVRYTGRGTPVDRRRRLEWGGFSTEEVAEDGLLLSPAVRYSDDSTAPESPSIASSVSHSSHAHSLAEKEPSIYEPPPELGPLEIERSSVRRSEEWDHIMRSVLATTKEERQDIEEVGTSQVPAADEEWHHDTTQIIPLNFSIMSKEQVEELNSGLEAELGLNATLDLGFVQELGRNSKWFDLNLLQLAGSSRASSPSVYSSQAVTLHKRSPVSRTSDHRSASSTKADADAGEVNPEPKLLSTPWWRHIFGRFRKVQTLFTLPKTLF